MGSDGSTGRPSRTKTWPSWKNHTSAPNDPAIDTKFMITALIGSTTEPRRRKTTSTVAATTTATALGARASM